jgi:predicted component of viral defense system (DUF524 family)
MMRLLLRITGEGWKIEIYGKIPELPPFIISAPESSIQATKITTIERYNAKLNCMSEISNGELIDPLFFEAITYDVYFEKTDPSAKIQLPIGAEPRRIQTNQEFYVLNFGNNVGFADFHVYSARGYSHVKVEIFSRKADYRTDYMTMREEVSGILRNLAMTAYAKTYGLATPAKGSNTTLSEWFALLQRHFDEFIKIVRNIVQIPHSSLIKKFNIVNAQRARRVSRQVIARALRNENGGAEISSLNIALPEKIHENVSAITFDTPENRYFKALIQITFKKIRILSRANYSGDEDADMDSERKFFDSIRPKLREMERQLEIILRLPFMTHVADVPLARPASMVFDKHPLYSRFEKLCRLLNGGLSFTGNIVPIGVKETALLYEYWCFLKIVSLLRERFDLVDQSVVQINWLRFTVTLAKGKSSAMKFTHKPTGKKLYVVYNKLFNRLPTIAQKPDNVIQFASNDKFYIFDAKYRIQFDRDYSSLYGGPGPTVDDINTMHRYRDAIVIPHPMRPLEYKQGVVSGAVVLFPFPDEANYRNHKFFKSISHVEIGGLPFLPKSTSLVAEKLENILADFA